jgi:chromosome segregation ATPase
VIAGFQKQLAEHDRSKEKLSEIYKQQAKDSAARLVEFSTKNATLNQELSALEQHHAEERMTLEHQQALLVSKFESEKGQLLSQIKQCNQNIQGKEDENEELRLKLTSIVSDLEQAKQQLSELRADSKREKDTLVKKHGETLAREVAELKASYESQIDKHNTHLSQMKVSCACALCLPRHYILCIILLGFPAFPRPCYVVAVACLLHIDYARCRDIQTKGHSQQFHQRTSLYSAT